MRCYKCMKEFSDEYDICPYCGYDIDSPPEVINHLYPGTVLADRYVVGVVVGSGGFGVVYKAWDRRLDHMICIKEYFPLEFANRVPGGKDVIVYSGQRMEGFTQGLDRFLDEAQNLAKFSKHENVVNVFDYFEENNTAYFVMEYLGDRTLRDELIDDEGYAVSISCERTVEIGTAVLNALNAIHGEHIIHRDIAPDNVFVLDDGKVKLLDFGAARLSVHTEQSRFVTLKPGYAPPEQYRANGNQGPWTDIYALGATLYRAVTGIVPDESTDRVVKDELKEPKDIVKDIPEYLNIAIMRAMALDVNYRFQTAQEFQDALLNKKQVLALQEEVKHRKKRRRRSLIASIMFLLICAGWLFYRLNNVNGDSLRTDISVWVCVGEEEDADSVKEYYSSAAEQVFSKDYRNINVAIKAIDKDEYNDKLQQAFIEGNAPEVFESSNVSDQVLSQATNLNSLVDSILKQNTTQEYYFLERYSEFVPDENRIPVGYSVPVAYSVVREYKDHVDVNELDGTVDNRKLTEDKLAGLDGTKEIYLPGDSSDYELVKTYIYGTYEEQKENVAGKLNLSVIDGAEPQFTTTFSITDDCGRNEKKAAELFVQYLLSYQEQHYLHAEGHRDGVDESDAFSINVKADREYRDNIRSAFSILDNVMDNYR